MAIPPCVGRAGRARRHAPLPEARPMSVRAARAGLLGAASIALALAAPPALLAPSPALAQATAPAQISREALQAAASDQRVRAFYEAGDWAPAWSSRAEQELTQALRGAERHGLNAEPFLRHVRESGSPAEREAGLTLAALVYADALASGLVDPTELREIFTLERNRVDTAAGLRRALKEGGVGSWLESLAPQDAEYRALSTAYMRLKESVSDTRRPDIPEGEIIRQGQSDPRVPRIAAALQRLGHLTQVQGGDRRYSAAMAEAVKQLQRQNGITVDGIVGPNTLDVLNAGPGDRARRLALNLERRRWLTREPDPTRIDVNTAATKLTYMRDGSPAWSTRVAAGQPDWATPAIGAPFSQLVVNPPWYVPQSIADREIRPKGADYMRRNNMREVNGRIIQEPGPDAALGLVKFDMQNPHAIYLHDTPAKSVFERSRRHLSHGCVRVQDAVKFARMLARHNGREVEFDRALNSGETTVVELGTEIPVRLLYHTAYLDEAGEVVFRPDAYGWDQELARALGLAPTEQQRDRAPRMSVSLGP